MKRGLICALAAASMLMTGCGGGGGGGSSHDQIALGNTGLAISIFNEDVLGVGGFIVVLVSESSQNNTDLNGDLDAADRVLHAYDPTTGLSVNSGMSGRGAVAGGGSIVAWTVHEFDQGVDLNGDFDLLDVVIAYMDVTMPVAPGLNPAIVPGQVDAAVSLSVEGSSIVYTVLESTLGFDATGDGDTSDAVLRAFNTTTTGMTTVLFPLSGFYLPGLGLVAFTVAESAIGLGSDLNLDGDMSDSVLYALDLATSSVTAVGGAPGVPRAVAVPFVIGGVPGSAVIGYAISESAEGMTNLNMPLTGDTDVTDSVASTFTMSTGTESITGFAMDPLSLSINATRMGFLVVEGDNGPTGRDLNGDGDFSDDVAHWIDLALPGTARNTAFAAMRPLTVCDSYLMFLSRESSQGAGGGTNLNGATGDTDTSDDVAVVVDTSATGIPAFVLGLATDQYQCFDGEGVFFLIAPESENNNLDLNLDGDSSDSVVIYYRVSPAGPVRGSGYINTDGGIAIQVCPGIVRIFGNAFEGNGFGDLNDDGDTDDYVIVSTRLRRDNGLVEDFRPIGTCDADGSAFPILIDGDTMAYPSSEAMWRTGVNANGASGDSDTSDTVVSFANTSCP